MATSLTSARSARALLLLGLVGALAVGCSDDGDGGSSSVTPTSVEDRALTPEESALVEQFVTVEPSVLGETKDEQQCVLTEMVRGVGADRFRALMDQAVPEDKQESALIADAWVGCRDMRPLYASSMLSYAGLDLTAAPCIEGRDVSDGELRRYFADMFFGLYPLVSAEQEAVLAVCVDPPDAATIRETAGGRVP